MPLSYLFPLNNIIAQGLFSAGAASESLDLMKGIPASPVRTKDGPHPVIAEAAKNPFS